MNEPLVSISCITYNHEAYIAQAIEGFLKQITNFPIEILIHDDASQDRTVEIIEHYHQQFPELIKPLYQNENQRSKGLKVVEFNRRRAKGSYIAQCEGDDYWIDPYKLQKQIDFLQSHPACSLCFHGAWIEDTRTGERVGKIRPYGATKIIEESKLFIGGGNLCPTASMVYRKSAMENPFEFYLDAPVGDHPLALSLLIHGRIAYLDELMSVRRLWVNQSWNTNYMKTYSHENRVLHLRKLQKMILSFNHVSNFKYDEDVNYLYLVWESEINALIKESRLKLIKVNRSRLHKLNSTRRAKILARFVSPKGFKFLLDLKRKLIKRVSKTEVEFASDYQ